MMPGRGALHVMLAALLGHGHAALHLPQDYPGPGFGEMALLIGIPSLIPPRKFQLRTPLTLGEGYPKSGLWTIVSGCLYPLFLPLLK